MVDASDSKLQSFLIGSFTDVYPRLKTNRVPAVLAVLSNCGKLWEKFKWNSKIEVFKILFKRHKNDAWKHELLEQNVTSETGIENRSTTGFLFLRVRHS